MKPNDIEQARKIWWEFDTPTPDFERLARDDNWLHEAYLYAADWRTCACGMLLPDELIRADESREPRNERLRRMGTSFASALHFARRSTQLDDPDRAVTYLKSAHALWQDIEEHAAFLLTVSKGETT